MAKQSQVQSRQKKILQYLEQVEQASLPELRQLLGCSETTVRNDLRTLEQHGMLRRTFGGAIRVEETTPLWLNISMREKAHVAEKREIAAYVADHLLRPNMTLVLDAGTTCAVLAQEIAKRRIRLTVLTNSLHAAIALAPALDVVELYLLGGVYNPVSGSMYDEFQLEAFRHLRADAFFMGADGVSADAGFTITGLSGFAESLGKRTMIEVSAKTYVLLDHSKFGRNAMKLVCGIQDVDGIVTDSALPEDLREQFRAKNVAVFSPEGMQNSL